MKVYVAAPWVRRQEAADVAAELARRGCTILHDWWNHEAGDHDYAELQRLAALDRDAVLRCDLFVLLNLEKSEGKAVETGLAIGRFKESGRPLLIGVGPRYSNIFQYLGDWLWFDSVQEFLRYV